MLKSVIMITKLHNIKSQICIAKKVQQTIRLLQICAD